MSNIFVIKEDKNIKLPVKDFTNLKLGFDYFNLPQSKFVKENLHKKDCNLIIAWSTSAGKTVTAELTIENQLKKRKKVVYACPLKALAEEKIARFKKLFHDKNIEIFTGDYNDFDRRKFKAQNADIAIVTTELLDSITRNKTLTKYLLHSAGAVIVDEFHIIATERGPAVEAALIRLPKHISIVLLSATVPNTQEVAEWIYSLNRKDTYIFESSYRPVKIDWTVYHIPREYSFKVWNKKALAELRELVHNLIKSKDTGQILIFVWTKPAGYQIEQMLNYDKIPCKFHNASLILEDRINYENDFETGKIKILIATTTLAWGKNTSARYVIIFGDKRGTEYVDGWDIIQMGGRAGRMGYTVKGDVFWFVSNKQFADMVLNDPPEIISKLTEPYKLAFHIIGEIPFYNSIKTKKITEWFKKTLAKRQTPEYESMSLLNQAFKILIDDTKAVNFNSELKEIKLTSLGRIAKRFYLHPSEVYLWFMLLKKMKDNLNQQDEILNPFVAFTLFLAHTSLRTDIFINKQEREDIFAFLNINKNLRKYEIFFFNEVHKFMTIKAYEWYIENAKSLMEKQKRVYPYFKIRDFLYDVERIATACSSIASEIFKEKYLSDCINKISIILKYGTPVETYDLLQIKGIGAVRASKLFKLGITNSNQLIETYNKKPEKIKNILPEKIIEEIIHDKKNLSGIKSHG